MNNPARTEVPALLALLAGALAIGSSGIFVRVSETGPVATAFWRGALALPPLAVWALLERRAAVRAAAPQRPATLFDPLFLWAGVFFAADIALWHLSLMRNSVGASTLEANTAPIVVSILAWMVFGERPRLGFLVATLIAFAGMLLILAPKAAAGGHALAGDALALAAAWFYAAYLLAVAKLRTRYGTAVVMFTSTLIFSVLLLPFAFTEKILPDTGHGWLILWGCALSAQALGQSLIAYGLAHLPATLGAVALYLQVVAAAVYAWLLLDERLAPLQLAGGAIVLIGIALARAAASPGR
ncbi:MAG TPA: DMT family transporter [Steroidobacteraceae bacterium]|nr:DMT family transporter [Steroidobacteraceae bacterium]